MPPADHTNSKNHLVSEFPQGSIQQYFGDFSTVSLTLRQVIYEVDAPLDYLYFVEQGIVSLLAKMSSGSTTEVGMIGSEGVVGLPFLLGDDLSSQHALVQAPGTALRISTADCKAAFDENAAVRSVMLRYAGTLFKTAAQTAACNQWHSLKERSARWLLMMYDRLQSDEMPLTHEFLSSMLGVRRTRVTEAAGELQRAGIIGYRRGLVTILDLEKLEATACECYRRHDRLLPRP
jgi:CRP-like cAMP-binding protein